MIPYEQVVECVYDLGSRRVKRQYNYKYNYNLLNTMYQYSYNTLQTISEFTT